MGLLSLLQSKERQEKTIKEWEKDLDKLSIPSRNAVNMRIEEEKYKLRDTNILINREREKENKRKYSVADKIKYFSNRIDDKNLSEYQRKYANFMVNELKKNN